MAIMTGGEARHRKCVRKVAPPNVIAKTVVNVIEETSQTSVIARCSIPYFIAKLC